MTYKKPHKKLFKFFEGNYPPSVEAFEYFRQMSTHIFIFKNAVFFVANGFLDFWILLKMKKTSAHFRQ